MKRAALVGIGGLLAVPLIAWQLGLFSFFSFQDARLRGQALWEDLGPTPLAEKGYTPQGMAWVEGRLLFANSWRDQRSRVYEIDPPSMRISRHFDMPPEAVHTSGLSWDGTYLWAVDHSSNRAYKIDLEASLIRGKAEVTGFFDTTLKGTSACSIAFWRGERFLAISDFMKSRSTIFVRVESALERRTADGAIAFSYENEGFSQGLAFKEGYLFEAENKWLGSVVNMMDVEKLYEFRNARQSTVIQYRGPARGIEDLAWGDDHLWTSDESVFRFFRGRLQGLASREASQTGRPLRSGAVFLENAQSRLGAPGFAENGDVKERSDLNDSPTSVGGI